EAIDENGAAARSGGWSGEGLEVGGEVFGIVGERVEVGAFDDGGAGVVGGFYADGRTGVVTDRELLVGSCDSELEVQGVGACAEGDGRGLGCRKLWRGRRYFVCAWGEVGDRIGGVRGGGRVMGSPRTCGHHGCPGDDGSGLVGDAS